MNNDQLHQSSAAYLPLSVSDVASLQELWREVMGEEISCEVAESYGRQLLQLYKFVYKPLTKEQYKQLMAEKQPKGNNGKSDSGQSGNCGE